MTPSLVAVLAVAALAPLVATRLRLPGPLVEIVAGIVLGPSLLGLDRPVGRLAVAGASAGEVAAVVILSVGLAGGSTPLAGRLLLLGLLVAALAVIAAVVLGVERLPSLSALFTRLSDTSAQLRVRMTVLLVAGLALAAQLLGLEAVLGAFLAGLLARALDPDPERTHPLYPVKLDAVGYGLLVPVFFVCSGLGLDLRGLLAQPSALLAVPVFLLALLAVRGLPALVFRGELRPTETAAVALLQATSLPFLLAAAEVGERMGLLDPAVGAGLVAAGLVSVLVCPAAALALLARRPAAVSGVH